PVILETQPELAGLDIAYRARAVGAGLGGARVTVHRGRHGLKFLVPEVLARARANRARPPEALVDLQRIFTGETALPFVEDGDVQPGALLHRAAVGLLPGPLEQREPVAG